MSISNMTAAQKNSHAAMLINNLGLQKHKATIVGGISFGRTESIRELTDAEKDMLIKYLYQQGQPPEDPRLAKMRNKIYYYAHMMNWTKTNKAGKIVADGKAVDEWMLHYSYLKKKLSAYSYNELPKLLSQFEAVYKSYLNKS